MAGLSIGSTIILTAVGLCIFLATRPLRRWHICWERVVVARGLQAGIDGLWLALSIGTVLGLGLFGGCRGHYAGHWAVRAKYWNKP